MTVTLEGEGGGRGYKKIVIWGDFQGITGVTRGGGQKIGKLG